VSLGEISEANYGRIFFPIHHRTLAMIFQRVCIRTIDSYSLLSGCAPPYGRSAVAGPSPHVSMPAITTLTLSLAVFVCAESRRDAAVVIMASSIFPRTRKQVCGQMGSGTNPEELQSRINRGRAS